MSGSVAGTFAVVLLGKKTFVTKQQRFIASESVMIIFAIFGILRAVLLKIEVLWDVRLCRTAALLKTEVSSRKT
jgi:hypothetical protein